MYVCLVTVLLFSQQLGSHAVAAPATVPYHLTITDPQILLANDRDLVIANLSAALAEWNQFLDLQHQFVIELKVVPTDEGRADATSGANHVLTVEDGRNIIEYGATYKLRTGMSLDPSRPDIVIRLSPDYLKRQLWLDLHPFQRVDPVAKDRVDFVTVLEHEMVHAFGQNGWRNLSTGEVPNGYMGVYDKLVRIENGRFYFVGPRAMKVFGGRIPLTSTSKHGGNMYHSGNPDDSSQIVKFGLMNGISFNRGQRYRIGALDVAILQDLGIPTRTKEKMPLPSV